MKILKIRFGGGGDELLERKPEKIELMDGDGVDCEIVKESLNKVGFSFVSVGVHSGLYVNIDKAVEQEKMIEILLENIEIREWCDENGVEIKK